MRADTVRARISQGSVDVLSPRSQFPQGEHAPHIAGFATPLPAMSATRSGGRRARADAIDECLRSPRADGDQRIHRRDLIERGSSHRRRDRRLLRGGNSERRDDRRGEQYEPDASVVTVMDMRAQRMRLVARVEVGPRSARGGLFDRVPRRLSGPHPRHTPIPPRGEKRCQYGGHDDRRGDLNRRSRGHRGK
jgi:hypothetical protein